MADGGERDGVRSAEPDRDVGPTCDIELEGARAGDDLVLALNALPQNSIRG